MNRQLNVDIVLLGRLLGLAVIVGGVLLAGLDASDASNSLPGSHSGLREFLHESASFIAYGLLVIAVAEIADRLGGDSPGTRINWNITELTKVLGVAIIVVGTLVTLWDLKALHDSHSIKNSQLSRYFLRYVVGSYLWQGGLLIVLAGVADRIGWRAEDESLDQATLAPADAPHTQ